MMACPSETKQAILVRSVKFASLIGGVPLGRWTGRCQSLHVVNPKFRHAVVIGPVFVARDGQAVVLYQFAEPRNSSTDRAVNIFPVVKEFLIRQVRLLGDAINQFDHSHLRDSKVMPQVARRAASSTSMIGQYSASALLRV